MSFIIKMLERMQQKSQLQILHYYKDNSKSPCTPESRKVANKAVGTNFGVYGVKTLVNISCNTPTVHSSILKFKMGSGNGILLHPL
jgi:hypothetical protein